MKINIQKDRLRDHFFGAPCGIGMLIRGILKSWIWISLHQGTLSILCSRIQGYMLSHEWSRYVFVTFTMCFASDAKPNYPIQSPWLFQMIPPHPALLGFPNAEPSVFRWTHSSLGFSHLIRTIFLLPECLGLIAQCWNSKALNRASLWTLGWVWRSLKTIYSYASIRARLQKEIRSSMGLVVQSTGIVFTIFF